MRMFRASTAILAGVMSISTVLGQNAPQIDNSGKGAVLCGYMIYTEVSASSEVCQIPRTAWDDALDHGIADIEDFIVANSSQPVTLEQLRRGTDLRAARLMEDVHQSPDHLTSFCQSDFLLFRQGTAEDLKLQVADMLSVPREPLLNPCL